MAKKRIQHEIKIIIILAILSVVFFGLTFGIKAIQSHQNDETQALIDKATMAKGPKIVEVTDDNGSFTLSKTDGAWSCDVDPELPISTLKITMMRTILKYFEPVRVITDAGDRWAEFGLNHPHRIMTLTSEDEKNTYLIGNYNPVLDEYYMALEGEDAVFMMSRADMNDFDLDILGYVSDPEITGLEAKDLASIKVETKDENYMVEVSGSTYTVNTGIETFVANQYAAPNILTTFSSSAYLCVEHKAGAEELAQYGLDDPEYKVTFTDTEGKTYLMQASAAEDGRYYARENESGVIYRIEERTYTSLVERVKTETLRG